MARLLFFGKLVDAAGARECDVAAPAGASVASLKRLLGERDPALGAALAAPGVRAVVNEQIVDDAAAVADSDEIAFIPPVSGG